MTDMDSVLLVLGTVAATIIIAAALFFGIRSLRRRSEGDATPASTGSIATVDSLQAQLRVLEEKLRLFEEDFDNFRDEVITQRKTINELRTTVAKANPAPAPAAARRSADPPPAAAVKTSSYPRVDTLRADPAPTMPTAASSRVNSDSEAAYRDMAAQATYSSFMAWAERFGAEAVEAQGDNLVRGATLANAAMVVVSAGATASLYPGAQIIGDFSTRYHEVMALRDVVGENFELEASGGSKLKLLAPARLAPRHNGWTLVERGRLGGMSG